MTLNQWAHSGWGAALTFAIALIPMHPAWLALLIAPLSVLLFAAGKEFFLEYYYNKVQSFSGALLDFEVFGIGSASALAVIGLRFLILSLVRG